MNITTASLMNVLIAKGYTANLKTKPYELNIVAIRTSDNTANTFNDIICLLFKDEKNNWQLRGWDCTTDAGLYYRLNPMAVDGTAVICPGYHKGVYKVGRHKDYEAMEQIGQLKYIRDNNRNKILDWVYDKVGIKYIYGIFKTNIHRANEKIKSVLVDKWSAGCIVFASPSDFLSFMTLIKTSVQQYKYPNLFDLCLIEEKDFVK